jgi:hypothetical protein
MEREALTLDNLAIAMAAKNSGGFVIAQVERIARGGSLNPREVQGPGRAGRLRRRRQPENHHQTYGTPYNPPIRARSRCRSTMSRRCRSTSARSSPAAAPSSCRWAASSTSASACPRASPRSRPRSACCEYLTLTAEPGVIGGMPQGGLDFGAASTPRPSSTRTSSSTSTTAAGSTSPASAWRRRRARATSTSAASAEARRRRRLHQHQPEREARGLRRHLHRRRARGRGRGRTAAHRARRPMPQVRRRGRADHLQRRLRGRDRPAGALRDRALRLPAHAAGMELPRSRRASTSSATSSPTWTSSRSSTRRSRWTRASSATSRWASSRRCSA